MTTLEESTNVEIMMNEIRPSFDRSYRQFSKSTVFASNDNCKNKLFIFLNDVLPLFHPFGPARYIWDLFIMIILLYTCIEAPVSLSFDVSLTLNDGFGVIALLIDISLLFDVIINFRTAYFDKLDALKLIIDPRQICMRYLKSWFIIDIATCIPFQLFDKEEVFAYEILFIFRLFKSLRIIKILRFLKMVHIFDDVTKQFGTQIKAILKLSKIIFFMLLFAHFAACCWWFVGQHTHHETSWIHEQKETITNNFAGYSYAWYWAVVTLFTTGYGDIVATNTTEQWVSSICIIIGTCFFSYFIGTLTVLITEGDKDKTYETEKLEEAQSFCEMKKLPKELRRAILTHIRYYCQYNYVFNENDLMQSLPPYLQTDIHKYLSHHILSQMDIFECVSKSILGQLSLKMRSISCNEDYELFKVGDSAKEIYIQRTGHATLQFYDNRSVKTINLKRGDVVGEYSFISSKRKVSIVCNSWTEFYVLKVNDILNVLKNEYPSTWLKKWKKIKNVISQNNYVTNKNCKVRRIEFNKTHQKILSDHHLHHNVPVMVDDFESNVSENNEKHKNPISINNTLSAFLQGASIVNTARFHGKKSIQTDWDGSIPIMPSTLTIVDEEGLQKENKNKVQETDEQKVDIIAPKMISNTMSIIEENTPKNDDEIKVNDAELLEFHRSQSEPTSSSVGMFRKAFLFKKNSSIRNHTISSAHKKKKSSLTSNDLNNDTLSTQNVKENDFYLRRRSTQITDSDDDEADIVPEQKKEEINNGTASDSPRYSHIVDYLDLAYSENRKHVKSKDILQQKNDINHANQMENKLNIRDNINSSKLDTVNV